MQYEILAKYYDALLSDDEILVSWLCTFCDKLKGNKILDMGCGSGDALIHLFEQGYQVDGFDLSKDMISLAKSKCSSIDFQIQDMRDFHYANTFDGVLCLMDTMNYILSIDDFKKVIQRVYDYLNTGGLWMFDYHQEKRIDEFQEEYIEEGYVLETPYQWSIVSEGDRLLEKFVFYQEDGLHKEEHHQRIFDKEVIISLMSEIGFSVDIENIEDEKYMIWGRK